MPDMHVEKGSTTRLDNVDGELRVGSGAKIAAEDEKGDEAGVYYYGVTSRGLEFLEIYLKMKGFLAVFGEDSS